MQMLFAHDKMVTICQRFELEKSPVHCFSGDRIAFAARANMQKLSGWLKQRFEAVLGGIISLPSILGAIVDYHAIPHINRRDPLRHPKQNSETAISVLCLILAGLVAIVDYRSAPQVNFTLIYVLIAAYAAWSGSRKAGILIALASSLASFVNEANHSSQLEILYWNLGVQIGISLFVVLLVSAVRSLAEHLDQRIKERTIALEREIGDRKQTEEQLRKTMQQLRQLAENISDAFWMRDPEDTRMVYVSPAYEKIWGRSCKELYQSPDAWLRAIHPEDREPVAQVMHTKPTTGEYNQEYRI